MNPRGGTGRTWIALAALVPVAAVCFQRVPMPEIGFFADVTGTSKIQFVHQASPTSRKYLVES